jgi:hypothetical protein
MDDRDIARQIRQAQNLNAKLAVGSIIGGIAGLIFGAYVVLPRLGDDNWWGHPRSPRLDPRRGDRGATRRPERHRPLTNQGRTRLRRCSAIHAQPASQSAAPRLEAVAGRLGLPRGDPRVGRLRGHALADEAVTSFTPHRR